MEKLSPALVVPLFLLYFVSLWMLITTVLGVGWVRIARSFAALSVPAGRRHSASSIRLGWVNYNHCVFAVVAAEGLYLRVWRIFSPFGRPLLIPWNHLQAGQVTEAWLTQFFRTRILLPGGGSVALMVGGPLAHEVAERATAPNPG